MTPVPHRYIVLAQGKGDRLKTVLRGAPKQAISLGQHSILERTLWMLQRDLPENFRRPAIVIANQALRVHAVREGRGVLHTLVNPGLCVLDGLAQTRSWWSETGRTVVLLGDVIWASQDLENIRNAWVQPVSFSHTEDLSSSRGEVFAVTWTSDVNPLIERCLYEAPCRNGRHGQNYGNVPQPGHLRNLKWTLDALLGRHCGSVRTTGFTIDIDTPVDYANLPMLRPLAQADDDAYRAAAFEARTR